MKKKLYTIILSYWTTFNIVLIFSVLGGCVFAQTDTAVVVLSGDTSRTTKKISANAIESTVTYDAADSIRIDIRSRIAYLFGNAVVYYEDMELQAEYIEIDFRNNELFACGVATDEGAIKGTPLFKQGDMTYRAHEIKYNFSTKKGKISGVITQEGEGFIHGEQVKKMGDNTTFIKKGKYTTCELDHPHFEIAFTKAKVLPNDKIITGPAYLSFGDVPTFLAIPFGYFPLESGRQSGLVIPTFGETGSLGFYLQNFGYYFGISDNFDLLLAGDIYTRGSFALKAVSNYVYRYKCNGKFNVTFSQTYTGEKWMDSSFNKSGNFKFYWDHQQDAKSHPTTKFSAHIDIISSNYNKYNLSSVNDYLSNQFTSTINFSTNLKSIFFFDASLSYSQNTQTRAINMKLPDMNMSVAQFYPFRKKNKQGKLKWFDNISMKWSSQFVDQVDTYDTLFFKPKTWDEMQVAMKHTIPLNIPIKIAKLINWNTNVTLTEKWYLQANECSFHTDTVDEYIYPVVNQEFKRSFYALHDLSMSTALTTKIYFMYSFKKGGLNAIRHVVTPNLSFTYRPSLNGNSFGTYFNTVTGEEVTYSYFSNSIFGGSSSGTQAITQLSFNNNVEIKVRSKKDTITGMKKVVIFDNLSLSTSYDFAADSLRWGYLRISGRSTIIKQLYITFNFAFDPYIISDNGVRVNKTVWKEEKKWWRFSNADISVGLNLVLNRDLFKGKQKDNEETKTPKKDESIFTENSLGMPNTKPDFSNPWSLTVNYTFNYSVNDNYNYYRYRSGRFVFDDPQKIYQKTIVQTLNVVGEFSVTKKWKVGFTTGYDFSQKALSYTSIDIYRDLHCWEMRFNWIPLGYRKGWSFTINVKASVLQDLKYNMKRDFRDNL